MEFFYIGLSTSIIITTAVAIATVISFKAGYNAGITANKGLKDKTK